MKSLIILSTVLVLSSCSLFPSLKEARKHTPEVRGFLIHKLQLTQVEKDLIENTEPVIGHANYTIYYYWWRDSSGENIFKVETTAPGESFSIISGKRVKNKLH